MRRGWQFARRSTIPTPRFVRRRRTRRACGATPARARRWSGRCTSGNPALSRSAAEALGRLSDPAAIGELVKTAAGADRVLTHSVTYALIEIANPSATLAAGRQAGSAASRRAALIAVDQMAGSSLTAEDILPLLEAADAPTRETGWWIATRHPSWGSALAPLFRRRLAAPGAPAERTELEARLALFATDPAVQSLLAGMAGPGTETAARLSVLSAMGTAAKANPKVLPVAMDSGAGAGGPGSPTLTWWAGQLRCCAQRPAPRRQRRRCARRSCWWRRTRLDRSTFDSTRCRSLPRDAAAANTRAVRAVARQPGPGAAGAGAQPRRRHRRAGGVEPCAVDGSHRVGGHGRTARAAAPAARVRCRRRRGARPQPGGGARTGQRAREPAGRCPETAVGEIPGVGPGPG